VVLEGDVSAAMEAFDWTGDVRPRWPTNQAVLYHLHPHAFTAHPSCPVSNPALRGTFKGVEENLPYLVRASTFPPPRGPAFFHVLKTCEHPSGQETLGVNTVVLDPVAAFVDLPDSPDYLGRASASLMAPHPGFATTPGAAPRELKSLVRTAHSTHSAHINFRFDARALQEACSLGRLA
jgi:pullulanase/glycogen debranching enzyme